MNSSYMSRYRGWGMGMVGGGADKFGGAFQSQRSPFTVDLKTGAVRLTIDIAKKTVTPG